MQVDSGFATASGTDGRVSLDAWLCLYRRKSLVERVGLRMIRSSEGGLVPDIANYGCGGRVLASVRSTPVRGHRIPI